MAKAKKVVKKAKKKKKAKAKKKVAVVELVGPPRPADTLGLHPDLQYHIICFSADFDVEHEAFDTQDEYLKALAQRRSLDTAAGGVWDIRSFFGVEIPVPPVKQVLTVELFGKEHHTTVG
jgi:hypothetical protein